MGQAVAQGVGCLKNLCSINAFSQGETEKQSQVENLLNLRSSASLCGKGVELTSRA